MGLFLKSSKGHGISKRGASLRYSIGVWSSEANEVSFALIYKKERTYESCLPVERG